jgi:polar amino acid transport system ATP-binding protein
MTSQIDHSPNSDAIEPMIVMQGVEKWFGNFQALSDINLSVRAGEKIVLCGPSGSGKSTLVRCINHLESYQKGRILIEGIYLDDNPKTIDMVRREVGMVFQQFNLFPHLTVIQNCTLAPMRVRRASRFSIRPTSIRLSFPAANSSVLPSLARSAWSPRSCCSMSRPARSTRRWSRRFSTR